MSSFADLSMTLTSCRHRLAFLRDVLDQDDNYCTLEISSEGKCGLSDILYDIGERIKKAESLAETINSNPPRKAQAAA